MSSLNVFVAGPSSWNTLIYLAELPEPTPHTVFADNAYETFGGTSLGKSLNLRDLGCAVTLSTQFGSDSAGLRISRVLEAASITVINPSGSSTERHANLMTRHGERLSIYMNAPSAGDGSHDPEIMRAMEESDVLVMDLSSESARLLPLAISTGKPIWTDIHDYDGTSQFHQPFIDAAPVIFMNADGLPDPIPFMHSMIERGKELVVCTLGSDGAVAATREGVVEVPAAPVSVIDTNGAGDAFMSGALTRILAGANIREALEFAALHTHGALTSRHLHPSAEAFTAEA
jgi:sugar/nucleoside kinase (ribokinase family)